MERSSSNNVDDGKHTHNNRKTRLITTTKGPEHLGNPQLRAVSQAFLLLLFSPIYSLFRSYCCPSLECTRARSLSYGSSAYNQSDKVSFGVQTIVQHAPRLFLAPLPFVRSPPERDRHHAERLQFDRQRQCTSSLKALRLLSNALIGHGWAYQFVIVPP